MSFIIHIIMKRGLIFLGLFLVLCGSVNAIGISPDRTYIPFEPSKVGQFDIIVLNTYRENITVGIELEGKLARYFKVEDKEGFIEENGMEKFLISYKLPNEISTPGKNFVNIKIRKIMGKEKGISAVLNVISTVNVEVPYPEKYVTYDFKVDSVNIGENLFFKFKITNKGIKDLFIVRPVVDVYSINNLKDRAGQFKGTVFKLASGEEYLENFEVNSTTIGKGEFLADAYVNFDGLDSIHKNLSFAVGYEDVEVYNHTNVLLVGGIRKYSVYLKNMWNLLVKDVYLEAHIEKDGAVLTEKSVSHTVDMEPLDIAEVPVFLDITNLPPGKYDVIVDVYYGELIKQERLTVKIDDGFEITNGMILIFILVLLVAIDIAWMVAEGKIMGFGIKHKSEDKFDKLADKVRNSE
jgi:hypothetical protein